MKRYSQTEYSISIFLVAYIVGVLPLVILIIRNVDMDNIIFVIYSFLTICYFLAIFLLRKIIFSKVSISDKGIKFNYFKEIVFTLKWDDISEFNIIKKGSTVYMKFCLKEKYSKEERKQLWIFQRDGSIHVMCFRKALRNEILESCSNKLVTGKLAKFKLKVFIFKQDNLD